LQREGVFLSFISFYLFLFVISPNDGRNSRPKPVAYMRYQWISGYFCCCIGHTNRGDINMPSAFVPYCI